MTISLNPSPFEEKLAQFINDEVLAEAVRAHILSKCDLNSLTIDDNLLSEKARAYLAAREILKDAFKELAKFKNGSLEPTSYSSGYV